MATATQLSPPEQQVAEFLSDILNLETIEVGFNCFLTHRPEITKANQDNFKEEFVKLIRKIGAESQSNVDTAVKYYLAQTAANSNCRKLEQLFDILQHAVHHHAVPARLACDNILNCDKLVRIRNDVCNIDTAQYCIARLTTMLNIGSRVSSWSGRLLVVWTTRGSERS